ncbi:exodeoxyribonuclease VII small subunit [candidate division KSB1 bacterium]|nr:exodeoxyribonuclease VII small subunit [candidate division KSB1 bacterium]
MKNEEKTLEHALARLEEIADALESGEFGLEQTMVLFEEAHSLSQFCTEKIDKAEEKLRILIKKDDTFQLRVEED